MKIGVHGVLRLVSKLHPGDVFFGRNECEWGPFVKLAVRVKGRGPHYPRRNCVQLSTGELMSFCEDEPVYYVDPIMVFNHDDVVPMTSSVRLDTEDC